MPRRELQLPLPTLGDYIEFHRKRLKLSREALGKRAYLSARTIQKLERGEQTGLTASSLNSLAQALELTGAAELRHLDELTRVHIPRPWLPIALRTEVTAEERAMLDDLMPQPAAYCNERWDVVAANDTYQALFPGRVEAGNVLRWLLSPIGRQTVVNWEAEVADNIGRMRAILAHFGNSELGVALLAELQDDPDFARIWLERKVWFDRALDEPQHLRGPTGPLSVVMQLQSVSTQLDRLHLCVAVVRPYSGPAELIAPPVG
ncbi:helix-turn-helix domain-containing protein [Nocardia sp. NPDC056100]|uniref:helix-turn-helix domain-containing protein n=1 Tax=Nocardia sp. NPDC056100 TaxID=3345712 RepID=UPI0035D68EE3